MPLQELLSRYLFNLLLLDILVAVAAIVWVLRHPREPRAMLAWILVFVLMPFIGVVLFMLIGEPRLRRLRRRRRRRRAKIELPDHPEGIAGHQELVRLGLPEPVARLAGMVAAITQRPPLQGNRVDLFSDGAAGFAAMEQALRGAQGQIHLEFYLFRPDQSGRRIAEILMERARAGVECRLLLDFIGSWSFSRRLFRELRHAGVEIAYFMPIIPWRGRWRMNFRNHRKIAVIDGQVAFTGSQNIGDEYAGIPGDFGEWRDTQVRLCGPVVQELQELFVEDWHYAARREPNGERLYPEPAECGHTLLQLVPSGPDLDARVVQLMLLAAFATAEREICIATPYFIPDDALALALQGAAYRGVKVRLLVPGRSDHWLSLWAGRSFYAEICAAGAEVYEYAHGMLHSKLLLVDGCWAVVGSANMDERSFRLNFEVSLLLYDAVLTQRLREEFEALRQASRRYRHDSLPHWGFGESLLLGIARLAAPLL